MPPVSATVEVIIEGGRIEDIRLLDHGNGMEQPAEAIIEDVVEDQSLDVDSVSGATYSSRVILKAIEATLIEAR
ncbi:FMN-binding protein [Gudongella oleilytica]|uniref:FMN-binding protein n=1 Tax=Gudongella oleilytica TaxID=1582259 RepID=UPI000FF8A34B|nr:FMN-binding protein [Gudongella oleilytica]HMM69302.1 FMN-binding protein [Gudongella oleilytica]